MLKGYKVLITGATSGIGLATAKEFLAQGSTVIGVGRNLDKIKGENLGENFYPFRCDVEKEEDILALAQFTEEKFGMLDTLILNAGGGTIGQVESIQTAEIDRGFRLLLRPDMLFVKNFVPLLRRSKNPSITFTASVAAFTTAEHFSYSVYKAAVVNYNRHCCARLRGIRCNAVCPGLIHTPILPEDYWAVMGSEENLRQIPSRRIGRPEEPAKLFAFLAGDKATYISGATITIDGGWLVTHPRAGMSN